MESSHTPMFKIIQQLGIMMQSNATLLHHTWVYVIPHPAHLYCMCCLLVSPLSDVMPL